MAISYRRFLRQGIDLTTEWRVYFSGNFWGHRGRDRAGTEIPLGTRFQWAGRHWLIPAAYACSKGLVAIPSPRRCRRGDSQYPTARKMIPRAKSPGILPRLGNRTDPSASASSAARTGSADSVPPVRRCIFLSRLKKFSGGWCFTRSSLTM